MKTIVGALALTLTLTAGTGNVQAGDLPSPDTCLAIEELEKVGGFGRFSRSLATQGECIPNDCSVVPKITNTCETAILLHVVFVERYIGAMFEELGLSGELSNITRFPGYFEPKTEEDWGTLLPPGETTYYGAYGPDLTRPSDITWGVCAEYYPESIHDASGYATCKASNNPETYWTCPDGTPFPPTSAELYEATDHLDDFKYSKGSPRERAGAFCRERD